LTDKQLEKALKSLEKSIEKHKNLIKEPARYLKEYVKDFEGPWGMLRAERRRALIEKIWPQEIKNFEEQREIVKGILNSRK